MWLIHTRLCSVCLTRKHEINTKKGNQKIYIFSVSIGHQLPHAELQTSMTTAQRCSSRDTRKHTQTNLYGSGRS